MNESLFKGRQLTVEPKRKNVRGMGRGGGMGRGRGTMAIVQQFLYNAIRGGGRGMRGRGFRGRGRGGGVDAGAA